MRGGWGRGDCVMVGYSDDAPLAARNGSQSSPYHVMLFCSIAVGAGGWTDMYTVLA